jgi:hypothetical protein
MTKIEYAGTISLNDCEIPCYVTTDGVRLLASRRMQVALKISEDATKTGGLVAGSQIRRFFSQKSLQPLFDQLSDRSILEPIHVKYKGQKIIGYDARILPDICNLMLKGRREGLLKGSRQILIAEQCEVLLSAFATIGITALIDEATGYQRQRSKDALSKILETYIAKELLPWTKKFPDEFYEQMFKLRGWKYPTVGSAKPGVVGRWTNDIVYERMPRGVLEELRQQNPKDEKGRFKNRHHQYLTPKIGNIHLEKHITGVIALMRASSNWDKFKSNLQRAYPKIGEQMPLITTED